MISIRNISLSFLLFFPVLLLAQPESQPLNRQYNLWLERHLSDKNNSAHSAMKPLVSSQIMLDSLREKENQRWQRKQHNSRLGRKLRNEHLFVVDTAGFRLTIDPLFNFQYGRDMADTSLWADTTHLYTNTRGIRAAGGIGERLSFETTFLETQSFFPAYLNNSINGNREQFYVPGRGNYIRMNGFGLIPGQGRAKPFKNGGYDYSMSTGHLAYEPSKHLFIQFGHGKQFIGDGYRSMLLSDNAFNYPFLRLTGTFWKGKLQYTHLRTWMRSLRRLPFSATAEANFEPKSGTFNYLNLAPVNWLQIGLFEGIIWQRWRDTTGTVPLDYHSLSPLIFMNSLIYGSNHENNALAGMNLRINPLSGYVLYMQLAFDDFAKGFRRSSGQVGIKTFDLFTVKNLNLQMEYNYASPAVYSHRIPLQNYAHYGQALAHPFGANFQEFIGMVDYRWRDFFIHARGIIGRYHNTAAGTDIFQSGTETDSDIANPAKVFLQDLKIGYLINQKTNMNLLVGVLNRSERQALSPATHHTQFVYIGFRTSLQNIYYDF